MSQISKAELETTFGKKDFLFLSKQKTLIQLKGSETIKYLNSISSNEIKFNNNLKSINTLMLTNKGRILFEINIFFISKDNFFVECYVEQKKEIIDYLKKYKMSYKIDIIDLSSLYLLYKGTKNSVNHCLTFNSPLVLEDNIVNYIVDINEANRIKNILIDEDDYIRWKILNGIPSYPNELNSNIIPIEANMWTPISFTKGCYIGQDTIARIRYRGKVRKTLSCIELEGHASEVPDIYDANGNSIGTLTSSYFSSNEDKTYALGFIKDEYNLEGNKVKVSSTLGTINFNNYKEVNLAYLEE